MPGITNPAEPYFKDGQWGWDGSVWRKLPLVFGYSDRLVFAGQGISSGAATTTAAGVTCLAGYIYVIVGISVLHDDTAARVVGAYIDVSGAEYYFAGFGSVTQNQWTGLVANAILKEDDIVTASAIGLVTGKTLKFRGVGYKMKIAE